MASESNAAEPDPAPAPLPAAPLPSAPAPQRPGFTSAPVGWVIAAMLVFWPTGIPALLASHRAARAFGAGDVGTAQHESANARRWGIISVIVGACLVLFWILVSIAWFAIVVLAVRHGDGELWHERPDWSNEQPFDDSHQMPLPPHSSRNG